MNNMSISIRELSKMYKLYDKPIDRVKEALSVFNKEYHKEYFALKNVTFDIKKGESVGIIGVNGAGKSTLLKIITGILTPTSGSVNINGNISALLELGAGFNPEYTGLENIYLNGTMMGYTKEEIKGKLSSIIEFADIGEFINQPVKTYSSGMFVRLAFSVAINVEPEILIVDEALSVGDVFFQQKCYQKIKELAGKSTVLIVSHDLNAMTKFCNRMIVMNNGEMIFDGDANEAITQYFKVKQALNKLDIKPDTKQDIKESNLDYDAYKTPISDNYSGNLNVIIDKYYYSTNGDAFGEYCSANDNIFISLMVNSKIDISSLIVGFQIRDKYGNEVFGETSLTSEVEQFTLYKGESNIEFSFKWPEIREGDYFITIGIGNGTEVLNQVEECWINNAIHLVSTTHGKTIFGVFNQDMDSFLVKKLNW